MKAQSVAMRINKTKSISGLPTWSNSVWISWPSWANRSSTLSRVWSCKRMAPVCTLLALVSGTTPPMVSYNDPCFVCSNTRLLCIDWAYSWEKVFNGFGLEYLGTNVLRNNFFKEFYSDPCKSMQEDSLGGLKP